MSTSIYVTIDARDLKPGDTIVNNDTIVGEVTRVASEWLAVTVLPGTTASVPGGARLRVIRRDESEPDELEGGPIDLTRPVATVTAPYEGRTPSIVRARNLVRGDVVHELGETRWLEVVQNVVHRSATGLEKVTIYQRDGKPVTKPANEFVVVWR